MCLDTKQRVWLMLHSGSRGVGNRIGTYFIEKAKKDMRRLDISLPDTDLSYLSEGTQCLFLLIYNHFRIISVLQKNRFQRLCSGSRMGTNIC